MKRDFIFDMGCFHHVEISDRATFIKGMHRVLKKGGSYLMVCFSYKNSPAWNHFTKEQIIQLFSDLFEIKEIKQISSIEGDGYRRYFYSVLMKK
jgi:cyclopropane fatty-acyl-phospholipid synthase-like methyltransferase